MFTRGQWVPGKNSLPEGPTGLTGPTGSVNATVTGPTGPGGAGSTGPTGPSVSPSISFRQITNNIGSGAGGTSLTVTLNSTTASGSMLYAVFIANSVLSSVSLVTDKGDSFSDSGLGAVVTTAGITMFAAACFATAGAQSVTASFAAANEAVLWIYEISGASGAIFDQIATNHGTSSTSVSTGSLLHSGEAAVFTAVPDTDFMSSVGGAGFVQGQGSISGVNTGDSSTDPAVGSESEHQITSGNSALTGTATALSGNVTAVLCTLYGVAAPQGPTGPTGATGATGLTGATGPGVYQVTGGTYAGPTGNFSTSEKMAGMGFKFTPTTTGNVLVWLSGIARNSTLAGDGTSYTGRFGTGAAPANSAAVTGTAFGTQQRFVASTTAGKQGFMCMASLQGLTVNTAYWFDVSIITTAGSGQLQDVQFLIAEVP